MASLYPATYLRGEPIEKVAAGLSTVAPNQAQNARKRRSRHPSRGR